MDRAPNVPWPDVPVQQVDFEKGGAVSWKN
jgi:hypothetical protein